MVGGENDDDAGRTARDGIVYLMRFIIGITCFLKYFLQQFIMGTMLPRLVPNHLLHWLQLRGLLVL